MPVTHEVAGSSPVVPAIKFKNRQIRRPHPPLLNLGIRPSPSNFPSSQTALLVGFCPRFKGILDRHAPPLAVADPSPSEATGLCQHSIGTILSSTSAGPQVFLSYS